MHQPSVPSAHRAYERALRVEVLGNAKTGTTGLYNSIRVPLRAKYPDALLLFEPRSTALGRLAREDTSFAVLAKTMLNKSGLKIGYDAFTHHVLIARDPRDTLVSQLLYQPLQPYAVRHAGRRNLRRVLALLREKEQDPARHSFRELFEQVRACTERPAQWSWDTYLERFAVAQQVHHTYPCFLLAYEDFADGRLGRLSAYLDLPIAPVVPDTVTEHNAHVVRSATHGDWRNWFLASDVEFFRPRLTGYMDAFGYDDEWTLAAAPSIPSETASGYVTARRPVVEAKIAQRFATEPDEPWEPESVVDPAAAEALRTIAEENDPARHGFRYAQLVLEGRVVAYDPARAFGYAYRAALVGNVDAMDFVAGMMRIGLGTEPDPDTATRWEREAGRLRARRAATRGPASVPFARRVARRIRRVVARETRTDPRTAASAR